jgi:hypothetical protein
MWDWIALIGLELQCAVFLALTTFWLPISDWLMRRRIRKGAAIQVQAASNADSASLRDDRQVAVARSELNFWYSLHARALFEKYMRYSAALFVVGPTSSLHPARQTGRPRRSQTH